jgi:hypothetical protein
MTQTSATETAQKAVLRRFAWADGHADIHLPRVTSIVTTADLPAV